MTLPTLKLLTGYLPSSQHDFLKIRDNAKSHSLKDLNKNVFIIIIPDSHPQSQVTGLVWLDNERVMSSGHDGLVKTWNVKF